ncbi:MAG: hypothetical protein MJ252_11835 [archaeon]|nr:hypothetical protein [archaeon]
MRTTELLLPVVELNSYSQSQQYDSHDSSDDRLNQSIKDKSWFFNNSSLCQYYGQSNIEKCLGLLFFLIVFSSSILYHYYYHFSSFLFSVIVWTIFVNLFSFTTYSFFLYRLKSESMFDTIPTNIAKINDTLIYINLFLETLILFIVLFSSGINWFCFFLFLGKYFIEIYFVVVSIKVFMFCPWSRTVQEGIGKAFNFFKSLFFCCQPEHEMDLAKYHKLDEYESFY